MTAQEALDEAKKAATKEELKDQVETIDDEEDTIDRTSRSSQVMRDGLSGMLDGLEKLRARTEEAGDQKVSLRFGSGHAAGGLYGTELWVNLNIPFGRLEHRDFSRLRTSKFCIGISEHFW